MPLNTLEKTWQYSVNHAQSATGAVLTTSRQMLRTIVNALLAFGTLPWTVRYSCDAVAAGTPGDGVNRWDSDTDLTWVTAVGGVRSWMVLRNTDGVELLLDCRSPNPTLGKCLAVYMSAAAGFTGGTTTARPTATDEAIVLGGDVAGPSAWGLGLGSSSSDLAWAWHALHSTDGLVTMIVICQANNAAGFWYLGRVSQPVTGWTKPVVAAIWAGSGAPPITGPGYGEMFDGVNTDANNPRAMGRFPGASARIFATSVGIGDGSALGSDAIGRVMTVQNELSGEWELPQIGIGSRVSGVRGMSHGRLFDCRWVSSGRNTGDTFPLDGSQTRACFGNIVIPWNGSAPLTA